MDDFYAWKPEYTSPVFAILCVTIFFSVYWFLSINKKIKQSFLTESPNEQRWINYVLFQKLAGAFLFGIIPAVLTLMFTPYSLYELGIQLGDINVSLIYTAIMAPLIILMNFFAARKPESLETYPQMRIATWTKKRFLINALGWGAYLFAYEFLFRGILLIMCYNAFGFWPAVAINIALYCCTHIPKGMNETIGAFPYAILLCYVTTATNSLVVSFFTHWIMSLSSDFFSVKYNPKMKFV